ADVRGAAVREAADLERRHHRRAERERVGLDLRLVLTRRVRVRIGAQPDQADARRRGGNARGNGQHCGQDNRNAQHEYPPRSPGMTPDYLRTRKAILQARAAYRVAMCSYAMPGSRPGIA